jgi:hypothetical protein
MHTILIGFLLMFRHYESSYEVVQENRIHIYVWILVMYIMLGRMSHTRRANGNGGGHEYKRGIVNGVK